MTKRYIDTSKYNHIKEAADKIFDLYMEEATALSDPGGIKLCEDKEGG